jgi:hypothetical protein
VEWCVSHLINLALVDAFDMPKKLKAGILARPLLIVNAE